MAEDFLRLIGHNMEGDDNDSSDSEDDYDLDEQVDPDADHNPDSDTNEEDDQMPEAASDSNPKDNPSKRKKPVKKQAAPNITFDKFLPGAHAYLGSDLEELRGRTVHDEDSYQSLPILSLPGVVLVPGQTLPLHLFQPSTASMMRHLVEGDKTFGLVTSRYQNNEHSPSLASIGTTAEILAFKEESDEQSGISTVRVKAIGRQRFEIKDTHRQIDGVIRAKVLILPEQLLPPPLEGATPASYSRLIGCSSVKESGIDSTGDHMAILQQWLKTNKRKKVDRFSSANFTWWPPWVYKMYDVHRCMDLVKRELTSWNETLKEESMPQDATDFSFWVAGNLPLDDGLKLHLLKMDSAIQRLRCELSIMQKCTVLCCKECGLLIANKNDVFSMAVEGPMAAYCNPAGYVHETFTVYKAQGLNLIGRPSTDNSWFPGYAWTIIQCRNCSRHMGWKFTAAKRKLQPDKFWGLCRSSLLPGLQNEDEAGEGWMPMQ